MSFQTESGYVKPGGDLALEHARVVHAGNIVRVKSIAASATAAGSDKARPNNSLTFETWKPFANEVLKPSDYSGADWIKDGVTVGADNITLTQDSSTGFHDIEQTFMFTALEWVVAIKVKRQTNLNVKVQANDGTTVFIVWFDMRNATVQFESGATGSIKDLGNDEFMCRMYFTSSGGTGNILIGLGDGSLTSSFTGDGVSTLLVSKVVAHPSLATWDITLFQDKPADMVCIAGHNIGEGSGRLRFYHGSWTLIDTQTPSDNSPLMLLFVPITDDTWRVTVDRCVEPEFVVIRWATALQFEQQIHQNHRPIDDSRSVRTRGTQTEAGQFAGRSRVRVSLMGSFPWNKLSRAWVDANLGGQSGMIQSIETDAFFIAWRPATYSDAAYCWTDGAVAGPVFDQRPNRMSWPLNVKALAYE